MSKPQTKAIRKTINATEVKLDVGGEAGTFEAVFSRFNVVDRDGDITLPGAIPNGTPVKISYWGHRWGDLPVGRGKIVTDENSAKVVGQFFMDTTHGLDHYRTVKSLGDLGEWSYGFDILDWDYSTEQHDNWNGRVRILKSLNVFEVSPVLRGAGIGTETTDIKDAKDCCPHCGCELVSVTPDDDTEPEEKALEPAPEPVEADADTVKHQLADALLAFEATRARLLGA